MLPLVAAHALAVGLALMPQPVPRFPDTIAGTNVAVFFDSPYGVRPTRVDLLGDGHPLGQARTVAVPTGCFYAAATPTRVGFTCPAPHASSGITFVLRDIANGQIVAPPAAAAVEALPRPGLGLDGGYAVDGIGQALVAVAFSSDHSTYDTLLPMGGGPPLMTTPVQGGRQIVDLDRPTGLRTLCAPLRVRRRDLVTYRPPWLLTQQSLGRARLRHCGSTHVTDLGPLRANAVLTDRYLAWARGDVLRVRRLADGRTRHIAFPHATRPFNYLAGTNHRLWIDRNKGQPSMLELR